jgi:hypothetical protein
VNKLNKQPWTADEGWSSSFGVGQGANNSFPLKKSCFVLLTIGLFYLDEMLPLEIKQSGGKLLPHSDLRGGGGGVGECFQREYLKVYNSGKGTFC